MHGNVLEWVQDSGIVIITAHPRMEVPGKEMAPSVSIGAVAGTTTPGTAGQRIATTTTRATATTTLAFAS